MKRNQLILSLLGGLLFLAIIGRAAIQRITDAPDTLPLTPVTSDSTATDSSTAFAERLYTPPSTPLRLSIENKPTTTLDLKGKIGNAPITIHLEHVENFYENSVLYTLKGWYHYDKYQQRIPLVGYRDYSEIVLYATDDDASKQLILDADIMPHRKADYTLSMQERLVLNINQKQGTWEGNGKSLPVTLALDGDLEIYVNHYTMLLKTTNGEVWGAYPLDTWSALTYSHELELIAQQTDTAPAVLLIRLVHMGNSNVQGRCGAAEDEGFMRIELSQDAILADTTHYVSRCIDGRYMEKDPDNSSPTRLTYTGTESHYENGSFVERDLRLTVNLDALTITLQ